jgi:hypothetical protein
MDGSRESFGTRLFRPTFRGFETGKGVGKLSGNLWIFSGHRGIRGVGWRILSALRWSVFERDDWLEADLAVEAWHTGVNRLERMK